ncbi:adenylate kinase 7-like isoform X2 [Cynoglossus semilaevis]|uniref:adenylate kinase 7-like isoform X2 n=1 Tax=Cynoglossus semilaevis TaxID=244447 RepID=UPI000D62DC95|nr:adenylate kinase 7-like isoform X2 [Cynoglossus semilaevis]
MRSKKHQILLKRVFINDVDRYSSHNIAKFLFTCRHEEMSESDEATAAQSEAAFQLVGTVSSPDKKIRFLQEQYTSPTKDELLQRLLVCDVVVYNIAENATQQQVEEATWAVTALQAESENFKTRKIFILVSTVMTWAMIKPQNLDAVLTEEDFRRRRPHPSFRNHNILEKLVLKMGRGVGSGLQTTESLQISKRNLIKTIRLLLTDSFLTFSQSKSKLIGYVVASGLQYGKGENLFHYFFKVSWLMRSSKVPIFGDGTNHIPMIHVFDLGGIIQNIIQLKPKSKYILAVDESKNTLEEIVKVISEALGTGKTTKVSEQEVMKTTDFTPEELQYLKVNLRLEAVTIKDSFGLSWTSEAGMVENMENIVKEFRDTRQIHPLKICLLGPPAVGKSTVSQKLCRHYQLQHIRVKELIEEKIRKLKESINRDRDGENISDNDDDDAVSAHAQLDRINQSMEVNAGRLSDSLVFDILKEKLNSNLCRNRGFVLDGFLKTYQQAQQLFISSDEEGGKQEAVIKRPVFDKTITPEHIFSLEASDDFLTRRVQDLPESVAEKMGYTHEEFPPRLMKYRQLSGAEDTLLDFFDELEIHPVQIEVTTDDPEYTDVVEKITEMLGRPTSYGLSPEEQEEEERRKEEEQKEKQAEEAAERRRRNEAALAEMAAQYQEWKNLAELEKQEEELLEARSLPLRNYLVEYVMPSLSEAMVDCCAVKPEDPVDFLAEHLLRNKQKD